MRRQAALSVAASIVLAACGSVRTLTSTTTTTTTETVAHNVTRTVTAEPKPVHTATKAVAAPPDGGGPTLSVKDFNGNILRVSIAGPIDPAQATDPAVNGAKAGTRLLAFQLMLNNAGPGTVSSDANSDMTVLASDGQDYTASFGSITECTNFAAGDFTIAAGDSQRGCVVFQLPDGINVKSVQFSLGNGTVQFNGS